MHVRAVFKHPLAIFVSLAVGMFLVGIVVGFYVLKPIQTRAFQTQLDRSNSENLPPLDRDFLSPLVRYRKRA